MTAKTVWLGLRAERAEKRRQAALARLARKNRAAAEAAARQDAGRGAPRARPAWFLALAALAPSLAKRAPLAAKRLPKAIALAGKAMGRRWIEIASVALAMALAKTTLAALLLWGNGPWLWVDWPAWRAELAAQSDGASIPSRRAAAQGAVEDGRAGQSPQKGQKTLQKLWASVLGAPAVSTGWMSAPLSEADALLPSASLDGCFVARACRVADIGWGDALRWGLLPSTTPRWRGDASGSDREKMAIGARKELAGGMLWWVLCGGSLGAMASVLARCAADALAKKGLARAVALLALARSSLGPFAVYLVLGGFFGVIATGEAGGLTAREWVSPSGHGRFDAMGRAEARPGESFSLYADDSWSARGPEREGPGEKEAGRGGASGAQCVARGACAKIVPPGRAEALWAILGREQKPARLTLWPSRSDKALWQRRAQNALDEWARLMALTFWLIQALAGFLAMAAWASAGPNAAGRFEERFMERIERWAARGAPIAERKTLALAAQGAREQAQASARRAGEEGEEGPRSGSPPPRGPSRV